MDTHRLRGDLEALLHEPEQAGLDISSVSKHCNAGRRENGNRSLLYPDPLGHDADNQEKGELER